MIELETIILTSIAQLNTYDLIAFLYLFYRMELININLKNLNNKFTECKYENSTRPPNKLSLNSEDR